MPIPPFRPLQSGDTTDARKLELYLRDLERQITDLSTQLSELRSAPSPSVINPRSLSLIKQELESGGSVELDLTNLLGVVNSNVDARIPRLTTAPDPVTAPYDTYVLVGTPPAPDTLWQIDRAVNPPVAVQIAFVPGSLMTLDTPQTVTAAGVKTVQASWIFEVSQTIIAAIAGSLGLTISNTSSSASAVGRLGVEANGGAVQLTAYSTASAATLGGVSLADWASLVTISLGGLAIGSSGSVPVVFVTGNVEHGRVDGSGLWTLSTAGKTLLIKPPSAPGAGTLMFEVQTNAGTSKFSVDIEGDVLANNASIAALTTSADSTMSSTSTPLTLNGTSASSGVAVFDVKYVGTTVFEVTGDGDGHFDNNLDVDSNLDVGGNADVVGDLDVGGVIHLGSVPVSIRAGTGSPEGVVTAPVSSLFLRTNGGASTTFYVKESGSGNTGWRAV